MRFLHCCFDAAEAKAKDLAFVDQSDTSSSSDEDPILGIGGINSDRGAKKKVLLEIVGAAGLSFVQENLDSFCIVKLGNKKIHQTATIPNDTSPIWTIKTNSLCMLELDLEQDENVSIELCYAQSIVPISKVTKVVAKVIPITRVIGSVCLSRRSLLDGKGEREEYTFPGQPLVTLALRFREATKSDIDYSNEISGDKVSSLSDSDHAADIELKHVRNSNVILKRLRSKKTVILNERKHTAFQVWPFPDPDNPKETTFMTKDQINDVAKQPSKEWVEGGFGEYGELFLEILGCDDLPNMDPELAGNKTDAFVSCLYEDTYFRTSVIHDSLNPRWVPWSHRAFMFQIQHPSSILFLGKGFDSTASVHWIDFLTCPRFAIFLF